MKNKFEGTVEIFPQDKGWHFVRAPKNIVKQYEILAERGLIAITANIGGSFWKTSLLPMGDDTHFIALPAKIRTKEKITLNDKITISFEIRKRKKPKPTI
jgi:hypothetical protein